MKLSEINRIKKRIRSIDPTKYWGDDFDVRYYVISKLEDLREKYVLDVGGGIGIISSELDESNTCVNLDMNISELMTCKTKTNQKITNVNGLMTNLPFKDSSFDHIVCCHVLDGGKVQDLMQGNVTSENGILRFPTVEKVLTEFRRVLKTGARLTLTVPNNAYYEKMAFEYDELKAALNKIFPTHSLYLFNTFPKLGSSRKLNLANTIPKLSSKIFGDKFSLEQLLKPESGKTNYSVSFYAEAVA